MADNKISLDDLKDIEDSFDSIKSDLNKDDNFHFGGNNYKNYDHDGNLSDDISNGKEKLGNAVDKAKNVGKNIKALDKMDKAAGSKGLKNGAEGLKDLAAGGDKTKAALATLKENLKKSSDDSSGNKSGDGGSSKAGNSGGESGGSESTAAKMAEAAQKASEEAKLAIKMASKIASQNYVGAAMDVLKNPAAFARLLKKIFIIIVAVLCIIVLIVFLPIILIACLFFWLLPGATTNSASKENPDVAVKDMSDGEKDVLDGDVTEEDKDPDMNYTIEQQYEQIYNVVYNECKEIFSSKEDEFQEAIIDGISKHDLYAQKMSEVKATYGSNLTKVYFNNLEGSQKSAYKVYSDVKKEWVDLDNHGFSPELESFNEQKSTRSFYDHADLETIADDIAYIMACYTAANGDCAPISEGEDGGKPTETTGYKDEFKEACEKKKVTENLFALTTTENHSNESRTMPSLTYQGKNWNAFLTADEIFEIKDNISGYDESKYPKNVYFLDIKKYNNDSLNVDTDLSTSVSGVPNKYTPGPRGEEFSYNYAGMDGGYFLKMGANVNLKNDTYKLHIGALTGEKRKDENGNDNVFGDYVEDNPLLNFTRGFKNIAASNLTTRYTQTKYDTKDFSEWLSNNSTLNKYSVVSKTALDVNGNAESTKNYTTSESKVTSYTPKNDGLYFASPLFFRTVSVTSYSQLESIANGSYFDASTGKTTKVAFAFDAYDSANPVLIANYDNDKDRTGEKNVYLLFYDIHFYLYEYRQLFNSHHINRMEVVIAENINDNADYYTGKVKKSLGINYRFKIKYSNMKVPIIKEDEIFSYDSHYITATVDGFDRDLITQNMLLDSQLYKDRMYENDEDKDLESELHLKDIKKEEDDDKTVENILNATWYSYDENFVYHCKDNCPGCCKEKEGEDGGEDDTSNWERIDNSKKDVEPGKGQHSKDTKFCTGTSEACEYCSQEIERWCSLRIFGWDIDFGPAKKIKVRNPEKEKEKCTKINKDTGKPEDKEETYTVKMKIDWFLDNILKSVENAKSLRTVAANSTSDVAIVAKAMQFQGSIGGENVVKFMGSSVYSDYKIWNAAFISFCAYKVEISTDIIPKTFDIKNFQKISSAKVKYEENFSLDDLKTGDIVYIHDPSVVKYTREAYPSISHAQEASEADGIGLVVSVDKTNNKVNVIEGCSIDKDVAFKEYYVGHIDDPNSKSTPPSKLITGGIVSMKQYDLNKITGYTRPAYSEPRGVVQIAVDLIKENTGSSVAIDYASFNSSNQLVVGYYKWTGNEAFKLLRRIYVMDKNTFTNLLKDKGLENSTFHTLIDSDDDPDRRNNFGSGVSSGDKTKILDVCKQMLQSPSGLVASESQELYDMAKYMNKVKDIYHESAIKVLLTDLMFAEKNPILLETQDWAKNFQGYFSSNYGSGKDAKALDVAKQYFVTDAEKNGVPDEISKRAEGDIVYLSKIPSSQFLTEEEQKKAEETTKSIENLENGHIIDSSTDLTNPFAVSAHLNEFKK